MKAFLNKLVTKKQVKHQTALEQYRDLLAQLARQDNLTEGDEQALERVIDELGYGPDQVENDANAMRRVVELKPIAETMDARLQARRDAAKALADYDAKKAVEIAKLEGEWHRLDDVVRVALGACTQSADARKELDKLHQQHPHLFP